MAQQSSEQLKYLALILLTAQQICMPLLARYTRDRDASQTFFTTVNVLMIEIIKLLACIGLILRENRSFSRFLNDAKAAILGDPTETAKVCFPALIYTLQNNLYYIAMSHLDATTFCILYQLKIFTTALFMRMLLGRRLSIQQWFALCLLVLGAADVEWSAGTHNKLAHAAESNFIGVSAVATMCFTSAIAGVYLERVLKQSSVGIWMQNIRLSLFGIPISLVSMLYYDWSDIQRDGMFRGFDVPVWLLTVLISVGGLVISMTIKYADNILKAYAQAVAIVGVVIGSWMIFGLVPSIFFMIGAVLVMLSIYVYSAYPYRSPEDKFSLLTTANKP